MTDEGDRAIVRALIVRLVLTAACLIGIIWVMDEPGDVKWVIVGFIGGYTTVIARRIWARRD